MLWMKVPSKMGHCPHRNDTTTSAVTDPCATSSHGTSIPPPAPPVALPGEPQPSPPPVILIDPVRGTAAGRRKQREATSSAWAPELGDVAFARF